MVHETTDQNPIKTCPFCGNWEAVGIHPFHNFDRVTYSLLCFPGRGGCGAAIGCQQTETEAIVAWNQRALSGETVRKTQGETVGFTDFGWALGRLRDGKKVCRKGWNGKGMWLALRRPGDDDGEFIMDLSYIFMSTAQGHFVPWLGSQTDMLAEDWELFG